jgi:hypothetical protein
MLITSLMIRMLMERKIQSARPLAGHPLTRSLEYRSGCTLVLLRRRLSEVRDIRGRPELGRTEPLTETRGLAGDDPPVRRVVGSSSSPQVRVRSVSPLSLAPCFWRVGPLPRSTACLSRRGCPRLVRRRAGESERPRLTSHPSAARRPRLYAGSVQEGSGLGVNPSLDPWRLNGVD